MSRARLRRKVLKRLCTTTNKWWLGIPARRGGRSLLRNPATITLENIRSIWRKREECGFNRSSSELKEGTPMANRDIESLKAQVDRRGLGYRQPSDHVKSADDLRTDSLRGRARREGGKGSWNRVENRAEFRRRMDLLNFPCPKCRHNVMRRKEGPAECVHCGTIIQNGGR